MLGLLIFGSFSVVVAYALAYQRDYHSLLRSMYVLRRYFWTRSFSIHGKSLGLVANKAHERRGPIGSICGFSPV